MAKYNLERRQTNLAAVLSKNAIAGEVVDGIQLVESGVQGYRYLAAVDRQSYRKCVDILIADTLSAERSSVIGARLFLEDFVRKPTFMSFLQVAAR